MEISVSRKVPEENNMYGIEKAFANHSYECIVYGYGFNGEKFFFTLATTVSCVSVVVSVTAFMVFSLLGFYCRCFWLLSCSLYLCSKIVSGKTYGPA